LSSHPKGLFSNFRCIGLIILCIINICRAGTINALYIPKRHVTKLNLAQTIKRRKRMKFSSRIAKTVVTAAAVIMLAAPVMAGNGYGPGDGTGGSRPKDGSGYGSKKGSCLNSEVTGTGATLLARGGNGSGGHGPGNGTGNGGNGPKDGTGNGNKKGSCPIGS
jgi:hypothetical protein